MDKIPKPSTNYAGVVSEMDSNSDHDETSRSWMTAYKVQNKEEVTTIALAESLKSVKVVNYFCCPVLTCNDFHLLLPLVSDHPCF